MNKLKTTAVFDKNLDALTNGEGLIINNGGTRSSKTFSILQVLFLKAYYSKQPLVISVVSYALPHLKMGAMREFDKIVETYGLIADSIKHKTDSIYKINNSIVEFFGVDNEGKVHGPERDILYLNEINYIKSYDIVRHLMVRTRGTVFMDYNPARHFWIDDEIIGRRECKIIHSTYKDNEYLTAKQIAEIEANRHNENWWRVYGLGLQGRLEDVILPNWEFGEFDSSLPYVYGQDFGSKHPDTLIKVAIDKQAKKIYWHEEIYKTGLSTQELGDIMATRNIGNKLIIADSASTRTITDLKKRGFHIQGAKKNPIVDDVKVLWGYKIIVTRESYNLQKNLNNWCWLDKKGEVPADVDDDCIDAGRYGAMFLHKGKTTGGKFNIPRS
jgi:phage terminase large subunit